MSEQVEYTDEQLKQRHEVLLQLGLLLKRVCREYIRVQRELQLQNRDIRDWALIIEDEKFNQAKSELERFINPKSSDDVQLRRMIPLLLRYNSDIDNYSLIWD